MPLKIALNHRWDITPSEAMALQRELARKVVTEGEPEGIRCVAAVDLAFPADRARAVVAVFSYPELSVLETVVHEEPVRFPYIPGLLSFRETPPLMRAFEQLKSTPDILLVDGQGIAHPRRFGIASHLGVIYDIPAVGCAKSVLYGSPAADLPEPAGSRVALVDQDGTTLGMLLRTRDRVSPVVVSVGHKVSLDWAVEFVLTCCRGYRIPEPLRYADSVSKGKAPEEATPARSLLRTHSMRHSDEAVRLTGLLRSGDEEQRWGAATAIGALGLCECEKALIEALRKDPSPRVRSGAAWALGFVGGASGAKALIEVVVDAGQRREVRRDAAMALGDMLRRSSQRPYNEAMQLEPSLTQRIEEALLSVASDRDDWVDVRIEALNALATAGERRCRLFTRIVRDRGERLDVRVAACRNLGKAWGQPALSVIKEVLESGPPMLRLAALEALYEAEPSEKQKESLLEKVASCLEHPEPAVREQALLLLADWGDERVLQKKIGRRGLPALISGLVVYRNIIDPESKTAEETAKHPVPEVRELALFGRLWEALTIGHDDSRIQEILKEILTTAEDETLHHLMAFLEAGQSPKERQALRDAALSVVQDRRRSVNLRLEAARILAKLPSHMPSPDFGVSFLLEMAKQGGWETVIAAVALGEKARSLLKDEIVKAHKEADDPSLRLHLAAMIAPDSPKSTDEIVAAVSSGTAEAEADWLFEGDWRLRSAVARRLLRSPPERTPPPEKLEELLEDDDPYVVAAAIKLLLHASNHKEHHRRVLALLAGTDSEVVVSAAVEGLGLQPAVVSVCQRRLLEDPKPIQVAILKTLARLSRKEPLYKNAPVMGLVEATREVLKSVDEDVRLEGCRVAAELLQLDAVAELLKDPSRKVRMEAVTCLEKRLTHEEVLRVLPEQMKQKIRHHIETAYKNHPVPIAYDDMTRILKLLAHISVASVVSIINEQLDRTMVNVDLVAELLKELEQVGKRMLKSQNKHDDEEAVLRLPGRSIRVRYVVPLLRRVVLGAEEGAVQAVKLLFLLEERGKQVLKEALRSGDAAVISAMAEAVFAPPYSPDLGLWIVDALWDEDAGVRRGAASLLKHLLSEKPDHSGTLKQFLRDRLKSKEQPPPFEDVSEFFKES